METIRSTLESKPISISALHLFQFTDIASRKLGPLRTSFLNLEFFVILRSPVKTWRHDSHRQNLYVVDNHILLCLCRILYRPFYFSLFCQDYIQQKDRFFALGLCTRIICYGKIQRWQSEDAFFIPFCLF